MKVEMLQEGNGQRLMCSYGNRNQVSRINELDSREGREVPFGSNAKNMSICLIMASSQAIPKLACNAGRETSDAIWGAFTPWAQPLPIRP